MQTIKIEKPEKIEDPTEWARGRNGMFTPVNIYIYPSLEADKLLLAVDSRRGGRASPIMINLKKKNWAKIIVAIGKELSR